jgi:hypothetical protein
MGEYGQAERTITRTFILSRIEEAEIFSYYMGVEIKLTRTYTSPLRKDKRPTCSFSIRGGRLRMRDWSETGDIDCFDLVNKMYGLSYDGALRKIAYDFKLANTPVEAHLVEKLQKIKDQKVIYTEGGSTDIRVKVQMLTRIDLAYLKKFGITEDIAKRFKCHSIKKLWVNGSARYWYNTKDPAIGYYFGTDLETGKQHWKIYFYKRRANRFISNTSKINGAKQLPKSGKILVITKSMKDVMVLYRLGYPAIAPQAETNIIKESIMEKLKDRFQCIFVLYDFDLAGIRGANELRRRYGLKLLFLTNGRFNTRDYCSKDISDYVRDNSISAASLLLEKCLVN